MINICNIERFATHDGPGIRTVVFFQGCPLRCPWCANPESQIIQAHLLYDHKKCVGCQVCEQHCPTKAIQFTDHRFTWDRSLCIHCKACEQACLHHAIGFAGEQRSIDDIMEEIRKDKDYYRSSHGGVTISGGEAFMQFPQLMELLKKLKEEDLHVTIETCGQFPSEYLEQAYPYIDLFYFDIKHVDDDIYRSTVKGNRKQVQRNMEYLTRKDPDKIVFRVPVIPGFNYDDKTLNAIIDLAKQHHVKEVHFLPYHTLGKVKYEKMLQDYTWSPTMMKEEELEKYKPYALSQGITLKIGG